MLYLKLSNAKKYNAKVNATLLKVSDAKKIVGAALTSPVAPRVIISNTFSKGRRIHVDIHLQGRNGAKGMWSFMSTSCPYQSCN